MNNIFVLSGPSGSGKSTLIKMLADEFDYIKFSVSHTTRKKRPGETDSLEYHFISRKKFTQMIKKDLFAEWAEVHDEFYGTSITEIDRKSTGSNILVLDIDVQGAEIIKRKFPDSKLVFIMPPDMSELKKRLKKREKELTSNFEKRINTASKEMERSVFYDDTVINDRLDESYAKLRTIFLEYKTTCFSEKENVQNGAGE